MTEPTLALALAAGTAAFLSPCMLPVIPAFLAQLGGTSLGESSLRRRDVFLAAALFVAGFSAVFAVLGVVLNAALQEAATEVLTWLSRLAGTVVIVLGLHLTGLLRLPFLDRQYSVRPGALKPGYLTSLLFGASFAVACVHKPEFEFEKDPASVREAVRQENIEYPVVLDNNDATWNAYDQRYWPTWYLIDADGFVRYWHIGEEAYDETEKKIQELLKEKDRISG